MVKKTNHTFSIDPNFLIWKILPDAESNRIIIESRDMESRTSKYTWLDLNNLSLNNITVNSNDFWWYNIVKFSYPLLLMEEYGDTQNPSIKNFAVYHVEKDQVVYAKENVSYLGSSEQCAFLKTVDDETSLLGINLDDFSKKTYTREAATTEIRASEEKESQSSSFPIQYVENEKYFNLVETFLFKTIQVKPIKHIEYLESGNYIVISYYIQDNDFLANYLLVLNKKGEILFKDKMNAGLQGIGSETFFIFNRQLIYVINKSIVSVYSLIEN